VAVTSGWTTAENSGLATNTAYVCIPLSSLPALTAAAAAASGTNSDIRALLYAINDQAATAYDATVSTNRPTNMDVTKTATLIGSDYDVTHKMRTRWTLTATLAPKN